MLLKSGLIKSVAFCVSIILEGGHLAVFYYRKASEIWPSTLHSRVRGRHGRDRMVVGFTTTYAISAYHH